MLFKTLSPLQAILLIKLTPVKPRVTLDLRVTVEKTACCPQRA